MSRLRAVTLIELILVSSIIALISAIMFPILRAGFEKSAEAACASNLRQLQLALSLYRDDWKTLDYGEPAAMGLPMPSQLIKVNPAVGDLMWACRGRPDPGVELPTGISYVALYGVPLARAEEGARPRWADYVLEFGDKSIMFVDDHHDFKGTPFGASFARHRALGVRFSGGIDFRVGKGEPRTRLWWHDLTGTVFDKHNNRRVK